MKDSEDSSNEQRSLEPAEEAQKLVLQADSSHLDVRSMVSHREDRSQSTIDWPFAVSEFTQRTIDIRAFYPTAKGERFLTVGHACLIEGKSALTSKEAIDFADDIARARNGELRICIGLATYSIASRSFNNASKLETIQLGSLDEGTWNDAKAMLSRVGFDLKLPDLSLPRVKSTVMPFVGNEFGFLYKGEETEMMSMPDFMEHQFEISHISYFRRTSENHLKTFVSSVLPSRFLYAGSPVFSRDSTLLGFVSETETLKSDAGRRAVVRSLLGHPDFMPAKSRPKS